MIVFWFCVCVSGGIGEVCVKFGGCYKIIIVVYYGVCRYVSVNVYGSKIINIIYDICIDYCLCVMCIFFCRLKN